MDISIAKGEAASMETVVVALLFSTGASAMPRRTDGCE